MLIHMGQTYVESCNFVCSRLLMREGELIGKVMQGEWFSHTWIRPAQASGLFVF